MRNLAFACCVGWALLPGAGAYAVQPDEMLADPALEHRAREISKDLRCLVCRNESIDDSNAPLARDLRLLVRERLTAGDSDAQTMQYIVERYGEYVLLKPRFSATNAVLWLAGPGLFLIGLVSAFAFLRARRHTSNAEDRLTPEEQARLNTLLGDRE